MKMSKIAIGVVALSLVLPGLALAQSVSIKVLKSPNKSIRPGSILKVEADAMEVTSGARKGAKGDVALKAANGGSTNLTVHVKSPAAAKSTDGTIHIKSQSGGTKE